MHYFFLFFCYFIECIKMYFIYLYTRRTHVHAIIAYRIYARDAFENIPERFFARPSLTFVVFLAMDFNCLLLRLNSSFTSFLCVPMDVFCVFTLQALYFSIPPRRFTLPFHVCLLEEMEKVLLRASFRVNFSIYRYKLAVVSTSISKWSGRVESEKLFRIFLPRLSHDFSTDVCVLIEISFKFK